MGSLIRTLLVLAIVVIGGAYLLGYLPNTAAIFSSPPKVEVPKLEKEKVAAAASDVKTRAVEAAQRMDDTLADTALTTKIKAKIALDDLVKSADVSIHTKDGVVTMEGAVASATLKERLLSLARETNGVKSVVDQVTVGAPASR
jgi:hyperosmotically inducible protein